MLLRFGVRDHYTSKTFALAIRPHINMLSLDKMIWCYYSAGWEQACLSAHSELVKDFLWADTACIEVTKHGFGDVSCVPQSQANLQSPIVMVLDCLDGGDLNTV